MSDASNSDRRNKFKARLGIIGEVYNHLKIIDLDTQKTSSKNTFYLCECECGKIKSIHRTNIVSGKAKSCGCKTGQFIAEKVKTHGMSKTPLYHCWVSMRQRCKNPSHPQYGDYGGRGILVTPEWESFETFQQWAHKNSYDPNLCIDRRDNNKGYSPDNCRFVTHKVNNRNTRTVTMLTVRGITKPLRQWADETGKHHQTLVYRIKSRFFDESEYFI